VQPFSNFGFDPPQQLADAANKGLPLLLTAIVPTLFIKRK
jgi:hypothetical protein